MQLQYMTYTDKQLLVASIEKNTHGKEARKEIKRRKLINYCDGTAIEKVDAKATMETESRVGMVFVDGVAQ